MGSGWNIMNVCIVNDVGFDGGGIAKLGIEYSKLGFDVYFKDTTLPLQIRPNKTATVRFYANEDDLIGIISKYDRVIFLTFYDNDLDSKVATLLKLRLALPSVEFCYLYCDRRVDRLLLLLKFMEKYNVKFDYYFSINPNILSIVPNCIYLNVNAFTFSKSDFNSRRKNIVLTAGRVEGFKGTLSYFNNIDSDFLHSDFYYVHEGARFNFNKSGTISSPPQLLMCFDTTVKPKKLRPEFAFKRYGELPEFDKLTIYPSYSVDDINRWSNYYAGICCILGSKSSCKNIKNLIGNNWIVEDSRENSLLTKKAKIWGSAVEYANLEMIDCGLPVLFSRKYSEIIDFHEDALIYNSFSQIPDKLDGLKVNYFTIQQKQHDLFVDRQHTINAQIKQVFTESLRVI